MLRIKRSLVFLTGIILILSLCLININFATAEEESGSINLGATVIGQPPKQAAVITQPHNGQRFASARINVSGSCPSGVIVEIYKNNIFGGSTLCESSKFSLQIDLVAGQNRLLARVKDRFNQYGPDSKIVTVYLINIATGTSKSPPNQQTPTTSVKPLVLLTNALYQGQRMDGKLTIQIEIIGGIGPYALTIDWGDGAQDLISRSKSGQFSASHIYKAGGTYRIEVRASDSLANSAYIQVIGIVNGPIINPVGNISLTDEFSDNLNIALVSAALLLLVILTFWLGEKWEFHELKEQKLIKKH